MYEYGIYIRNRGGLPYMFDIFDNSTNCKIKLLEYIANDQKRLRPYFVDNDFFDNEYSLCTDLRYFRILCREVGDWHVYSEKQKNSEKNGTKFLTNFHKLQTFTNF